MQKKGCWENTTANFQWWYHHHHPIKTVHHDFIIHFMPISSTHWYRKSMLKCYKWPWYDASCDLLFLLSWPIFSTRCNCLSVNSWRCHFNVSYKVFCDVLAKWNVRNSHNLNVCDRLLVYTVGHPPIMYTWQIYWLYLSSALKINKNCKSMSFAGSASIIIILLFSFMFHRSPPIDHLKLTQKFELKECKWKLTVLPFVRSWSFNSS